MSKLIRDLIPEDMRRHGYEPVLEKVGGDLLRQALLDKLQEECQEVLSSNGLDASELADVYEVLVSLEALHPRSTELDIVAIAEEKRQRRGGFMGGTLWVNPDDKSSTAIQATRAYREAEERSR